ncbi:hypothetical protein [uncultured Polaribacter sp.]|uniref:hypothetical protein n=1 Tax=uncultured Polaribacter sp. TaxID=174711 RepID=UPI0026295F97|nr:hypothetical protein [uncultured Polaribacter sp.]
MIKKKGLFIVLFFILKNLSAQKQEPIKDTVKTEVVTVITKYNPKIADVKKITKAPKLEVLESTKRKKLKYTIFSAPVASTFIPKSGTLKGINVGIKERIYKNYLALGYGNYNSPYLETYLSNSNRFKNEFGVNIKYTASYDNIKNSELNSDFSNLKTTVFYKQHERYFDWITSINFDKNNYNWHGLQNNNYSKEIINNITENQYYNAINLFGQLKFKDSYIDYTNISATHFSDRYNSAEYHIKFDSKIDFPLDFISNSLNNLSVKNSVEYLNGNFKNNYLNLNSIDYATFTLSINPSYLLELKNLKIKTGFKVLVAMDDEKNATTTYLVPDVTFKTNLIDKYVSIYGSIYGNLHTNKYHHFSLDNPFISPTLLITQTFEKINTNLGLQGKINDKIDFNFKATYKIEEDKPLFIKNISKDMGNNQDFMGNSLRGYEYGNSFKVVYDNVNTTSFLFELEYNYSKSLSFQSKANYAIYKLENEVEAWNLPTLETNTSIRYKNKKWFLDTNIMFVSNRKDLNYNNPFPSNTKTIKTIDAFLNASINGGYHFNDKFSSFIKLNNLLNSNYQQFANFNTQGFQALAGITYKFDF